MKKTAFILAILMLLTVLFSCSTKTVTFPTMLFTMEGNELTSYNILIKSKNGGVTSEGDGNKYSVEELIKTKWESFPINGVEAIKNFGMQHINNEGFIGQMFVEGVYKTDGTVLTGGISTETSCYDIDLPEDFKNGESYIICVNVHVVTEDNKSYRDEYFFIRVMSSNYHKTEETIDVDWDMFVRCNGKIYKRAEGQTVSAENIGEELGTVKTHIPSSFTSSEDYQAALVADFASPCLEVGTKLFAINDSTDIVAEVDGQYILFIYDTEANG